MKNSYLLKSRSILNSPQNISSISGIHKADTPVTNRHYVIENPYDLAPIDQIIWANIQEEINNLKTGERLAIVIGECHAASSQVLAQVTPATNLARWMNSAPHCLDHKFIYAQERPYNYIEELTEHLYNLSFSPAITDTLNAPSTSPLLQTLLVEESTSEAMTDTYYAPAAARRRFEVCIDNKIPIIFNDAAYNFQSFYIDPEDPVASEIALFDYGIDLRKEEIPVAPEFTPSHGIKNDVRGLAIRNGTMVARSKKHPQRIILQNCGASHLYGNRHTATPYKTALIPQYEKAGYKTLGIYFSLKSIEEDGIISPENIDNHPNHIIIDGLDSLIFDHSETTQAQIYNALSPKMIIQERQHINTLTHAYSRTSCPFVKPNINLPTSEDLLNSFINITANAPQI